MVLNLVNTEVFGVDTNVFFTNDNDVEKITEIIYNDKQLNMDSLRVFLIVRVFLEAKFVIINDGLLNAVENPEKTDIQDTIAYRNAQKQMQAEELFLYSSFKEIITSVT